MRKPRIAIITGNYNHIRDGVSNTLNRLVAYLESHGYPVLVFGPWSPSPDMDHSGEFVPVYAIPAPFRPEYRVSLGFPGTEKQRLRDFHPDIIHIATPDLLGFFALRWAKSQNIPVVSSYHTHFSSYLKYYKIGTLEPLMWMYLRWFYKQCLHLYVPSVSMIEDLAHKNLECKLKLWARGVDTSLFHPDKRDSEWRRARGFTPDDIVVSFISRLVWEKNLNVVAETFKEIKKINPAIRTLIVGDGPAMEDLKGMLPDTVFTGYLEGVALAGAYAGSDIFFFPSDTESFGNVTLEAMSCGLPAVVADASGSRSLVENQENGYIAKADDVDAFVTYILDIAENKKKRETMALESRKRAGSFDWDRVMESIVVNYHEIFDKKHGMHFPEN